MQTMTFYGRWIEGWNGLLDLVTSYKTKETGVSPLQKALDFYQNRQRRQTEIREAQEGLTAKFKEVMGLEEAKTNRAVNAKMAQDLKRVHDIFMGAKNLYSMAEIRQLWMYMQDTSLTNRLENMGIDDGVRARVNQILDENPQDKEIAQWIFDQFNSDFEYSRNNEVYQKVYGTDLGRLPNYTPVRSEWYHNALQQQQLEGEILPQYAMDSAMRVDPTSAKSLNERSANADNSPLIITGDVGLYMGYQHEMAHFRNYAEKVRSARAIVNNNDFKKMVISEYGNDTYQLLKRHLDDISANGTRSASNIPLLDNIRSAWVSSTIGMSLSVTLKQLISVVNYWQHVPTTDLIGGMMGFWTSPRKNFREMQEIWNSDYLKNRRFTGIDRDFMTAQMGSNEYKKFRLNPSVENFLTYNVRIGDNAAIMIGGWVLYNHLKNSTKNHMGRKLTHNEALQELGRLSEQTQQSSAIEERSEMQRGGSFARLATTYSTGPVQAVRQETKTIRDLLAGRISKAQAAKTLFIYHVLVPSMYLGASSIISGDDFDDFLEVWKKTGWMGPFASTYALGRSVYNGVRRAAGLKYYQDSGMTTELVMDISKVMRKVLDGNIGDLDLDDYSAAIQAGLIGKGYKIPLQRTTRSLENAVQGDIKGVAFGTNPDN